MSNNQLITKLQTEVARAEYFLKDACLVPTINFYQGKIQGLKCAIKLLEENENA
jgi:hypothetical protein